MSKLCNRFSLKTSNGVTRMNDRAAPERTSRLSNDIQLRSPFSRIRGGAIALLLALLMIAPCRAIAIDADEWNAPPITARPVARWWWPGGAVDESGIKAQLRSIHAAGFGAVEVQPLLLGISDEDLAADPRIRSVGSEYFTRHVGIAAREARSLGLAFDLTLGSGWPGGLPNRNDAAERQLLVAGLDLDGGSRLQAALPPAQPPDYVADVQRFLDTMGPFDPDARLVAVLAVRLQNDATPAQIDRVEDLSDRVREGRIDWQVPDGRWRLLAFWENRTGHSVLGGAYPGDAHDALTVDHLHARGARALWSGYADPLLAAAPPGSVRGVFIDSFELIGELPWTQGFRAAFRSRKGYDVTPHLPLLFRKGGESKYSEMVDFLGRNGGPLYLDPGGGEFRARVREDYVDVRQVLFLEEFLGTFTKLAEQNGVEIRLQAHGGFADYLDAYALADVPESEGLFAGGSSDFLKLASSAAHVAGRRISSSESFITLRFYGYQLEKIELDLLAGRTLGAGINQLAYHGVPYRYARSDGKEWYPFSGGFGRVLAGPLPMTTWFRGALWEELPQINTRFARLCYAMQQGEHKADVAWLRAEGEFPDAPSFEFGRVDPHEGESAGARALRQRGLVHDRVSRSQLRNARLDDGLLRVGAARYRALILDPMEVAEPGLMQRAVAAALAGVRVIVIGGLPHRAPGLVDAAARDAALRAGVEELRKIATIVSDEASLTEAFDTLGLAGPLVAADGEPLSYTVDHRLTDSEHIVLVFNESWSKTRQNLQLNVGTGPVFLLDPVDGTKLEITPSLDQSRNFELSLEPAQSMILTVAR